MFICSRVCVQLHVAAANGYMQVAEFLLKQGASVDLEDRDGWLPIHIAACWGYVRSSPHTLTLPHPTHPHPNAHLHLQRLSHALQTSLGPLHCSAHSSSTSHNERHPYCLLYQLFREYSVTT